MFTKNETEAYRAIKAPDYLREQILSHSGNRVYAQKASAKKQIYRFASLAACLVIAVILIFYFNGGKNISLSVGDREVLSEAINIHTPAMMSAAEMRSGEYLSIDLEIKTSGPTQVFVSAGNLSTDNKPLENPLYIEDSRCVCWEIIAPDSTAAYELRIQPNFGKSSVFTLTFDSAENCWTISRS